MSLTSEDEAQGDPRQHARHRQQGQQVGSETFCTALGRGGFKLLAHPRPVCRLSKRFYGGGGSEIINTIQVTSTSHLSRCINKNPRGGGAGEPNTQTH